MEKFASFIDWPFETEIDDTSKVFILTVIGENPFGELLDKIYIEKKIRGKKVEIRYISSIDEIKDCHILFISENEEKKLSKIISVTKDKPILTVSETKGFAERGVLINFYLSKSKIGFEVNQSGFKDSPLSIRLVLLQIGKIVNPLENK